MNIKTSVIYIGLLIGVVFAQSNCTFTNTMGQTYDLSPLIGDEDYVVKSGSYQFWLNVCKPVSTTVCGSEDVAICQSWGPGSASLGSESSLIWSGLGSSVFQKFSGGDTNRRSQIAFICDSTAGFGAPVFINENPPLFYTFWWNTSYACPTIPKKSNIVHF